MPLPEPKFRLGQRVRVSERSISYTVEGHDQELIVIGLTLEPHGRVTVTTADGLDVGRWDGVTDQWPEEDLTLPE